MTRLEAFKILFPEAALDENGYPNMLPCQFAPCYYPKEHSCFKYNCDGQFWNKEIGFKFVKEVNEI